MRATEETDAAKPGVDIYRLMKFQRSNQSTCINQKPLVKVGDRVDVGDIIADGPSTDLGDLALGRNVLVAFMPWNGYNFEDSILLSERIVKDDVFTSIHIEEFEAMARDTKLGPEEITRDIPNVSEEALKNLDEAGIVYIGAEVQAGDILVGKITPEGRKPDDAGREASARHLRREGLRRPRHVAARARRACRARSSKCACSTATASRRTSAPRRSSARRSSGSPRTATTSRRSSTATSTRASPRRSRASARSPGRRASRRTRSSPVRSSTRFRARSGGRSRSNPTRRCRKSRRCGSSTTRSKKSLENRFLDKVEKLQRGDELPPGVMKMVKVFIAVKRKIQPGDKMAGRHGNKGVVSRIVPQEDMPFLADGQPVDIVLNPLGVPSRMNVGQILETHLGWACAGLGRQVGEAVDAYLRSNDAGPLRGKLREIYGEDETIGALDDESLAELGENLRRGVPIATPVFDGAREKDIVEMLKKAGLDSSGQVTLFDGRTGDPFDRKVTVGYIYMLKLHHLVDDKIHARSIGPYSLVTQQPLGGKAQFGGQRFGEMEVWALEAYGAAYTLQEMLTVKSDDVAGRTKVYEAIVRGDDTFESGIPESFNVLVKEMRSLGLNVELASIKRAPEEVAAGGGGRITRRAPAS